MTTIIGIKANADSGGIVLAADTQINFYNGVKRKDFNEKRYLSKIRVGRSYAAAFVGTYDKYLESFFSFVNGNRDFDSFLKFVSEEKDPQKLLKLIYSLGQIPRNLRKKIQEAGIEAALSSGSEAPKNEIERVTTEIARSLFSSVHPLEAALARKYFAEFNILNRYALIRGRDLDESSELLLASNKPELDLFRVDPFGNLTEARNIEGLEYICLGSGAEAAKTYIDNEDYEGDAKIKGEIKIENLTVGAAIRLAIRALKIASKDAFTGGPIEFVVVKNDRVEDNRGELKRILEEAESGVYERIVQRHE